MQRRDQGLINKGTYKEVHTSRSVNWRMWTLNPEVKETKEFALLNVKTRAYERHPPLVATALHGGRIVPGSNPGGGGLEMCRFRVIVYDYLHNI